MSNLANDKNLFEHLNRYAHNFNWTCLAPKCKGRCISSHVLQKNGILSRLSVDRHLIELKPSSMWEIENQGSLKFQKIGINDAFTFPGFCSIHDNSIFQIIEKPSIDFDNYRVQLLFSYRGLCQEIRRKQIVKLFLNQVLANQSEFKTFKDFELFEDYRNGLESGIRNLNYFKKAMEADLKNNSNTFRFFARDTPYIEICTSAPINVKEPDEHEYENLEELNQDRFRKRLPAVFINIFPIDNITKWIVGEHALHPSRFTPGLLNPDWQQVLTNLLVLRMEYWCMSKAFLDKHIAPNLDEIKKSFAMNALNFEYDLSTALNIFK